MPLTKPTAKTPRQWFATAVCASTFNQREETCSNVLPAAFQNLAKHLDCAQHKAAMAAAEAILDWQPAPLVGHASWIEYVR
jgi:hypothetical protein